MHRFFYITDLYVKLDYITIYLVKRVSLMFIIFFLLITELSVN